MHNTALRAAPGVFDLLGVCSALLSSARLARVRSETCAERIREQARPPGRALCSRNAFAGVGARLRLQRLLACTTAGLAQLAARLGLRSRQPQVGARELLKS